MDGTDDGTCTVPSCDQKHSSGLSSKTITLITTTLLAVIPIFIIYGVPAIWTWTGIIVGRYVRGKTEGRQEQVLKSFEEDERIYAVEHKNKSSGNTKEGGKHWKSSGEIISQAHVKLTC